MATRDNGSRVLVVALGREAIRGSRAGRPLGHSAPVCVIAGAEPRSDTVHTMTTKPRTPMTFADIQRRKKLPTVDVPICLDAALTRARDTAEEEVERIQKRISALSPAKSNDAIRHDLMLALSEAQARHAEAVEAAAEDSVIFTLRALPPGEFQSLERQHHPTPAQEAEAAEQARDLGVPGTKLRHNVMTFPPALFQLSCIEPALSDEETAEMWFGPKCEPCGGEGRVTDEETGDEMACPTCKARGHGKGNWSDAELETLYRACLLVNRAVPS